MKKLTLDLEHLRVQSFETAAAGAADGTVRGHDNPVYTNETQQTEVPRACTRTMVTGCLTCPVPCTLQELGTCDALQCGV